ncbi:sugar ABC transporter permease [Phycicoccus sp. BSK3Z-2]|uniref:Sugar ABC transporter permease n=1 Tax=Phycicoccus avicenniae TaxID=2828860 RepID=A0A941HXH0_9MICO|nr:sugar ABC transporter permease [Phycicoccus avicenniae]MBR7741833.1 sugar ABC transporter permease [Phycicoccus avicenniae]
MFSGIAVFYLYPVASTAYYSFTSWEVFGGASFTGLTNYRRLLEDTDVVRALVNTVVYTGIVLLGIPLGVVLAALISRPGLRFSGGYRVIFLMSYIAMPVAIALVWRQMFKGDYGVVNWFLSLIGVDGPFWLGTEWYALFAVSIVGLWIALGFNIIILAAGLRGIPKELYEASALDGAGRMTQFRHITVPLLTPSIFFVLVINVIAGFKLFDLLYILLEPTNPVMPETQSLVFLFYNESFVVNDKGYGATIAMLILVLIGIFTSLQFRWEKRWVHYVK